MNPFRRAERRAPRALLAWRAPRALLAWEVGAGFTHSQNLWGVARHLRNCGVDCTIATADPRFDPWFRAIGANVLQTYLWPAMRSGIMAPEHRPARDLADIIANYGMMQPANLQAALAHYDTLFELVRPDIVLCENAFGALLAARGRVRTIVFGSTLLFMPPLTDTAFTPIDAALPDPSWPVADLLDAINAALGASARPPLLSPRDMFDGADIMPFGPAAFDPYAGARREAVLAPHCPDLPPDQVYAGRDEIVVYLHESVQHADALMAQLLELPAPARLYIPSLGEGWRARFAAAGIAVEDRMMPLDLIAARAACLVHHGGVTLSAAALACGIPQIILARFYENGIAGRYVEGEGLGHCRKLDAVEPGWLAAAALGLARDPVTQGRAMREAPRHRAWFGGDPTHAVAVRAAQALGLPPPRESVAERNQAWSPL